MSLHSSLFSISKRSWHYRLVVAFHKFCGEEFQVNTSLGYWLIEVPTALVLLPIMAAILLTFAVCSVWGIGAASFWALQNPIDFAVFSLIIAAGSALTLLFTWASVILQQWLKQNGPKIQVRE